MKTKKVFDRLKIPFFLSSGTCLGYFRENKFIDHDYDIDIRIAMLAQDPPETCEMSVFNYVALGLKENGELIQQYHQLIHLP